jgi:hypothetical protein
MTKPRSIFTSCSAPKVLANPGASVSVMMQRRPKNQIDASLVRGPAPRLGFGVRDPRNWPAIKATDEQPMSELALKEQAGNEPAAGRRDNR